MRVVCLGGSFSDIRNRQHAEADTGTNMQSIVCRVMFEWKLHGMRQEGGKRVERCPKNVLRGVLMEK